MSRKRRVVLVIVVTLIVALVAPTAIRWINGSIPRDIVGGSPTCGIEGAYYPINVMVVSELDIADRRAEISGASYSLLRPLRTPAPTRIVNKALPSDWGPGSIDVTKAWQLQTDRQPESTVAMLGHREVRLELILPPGQGVVLNRIFELGVGDYGIVVTAGDWKVGPISYVGFVRARCGSK